MRLCGDHRPIRLNHYLYQHDLLHHLWQHLCRAKSEPSDDRRGDEEVVEFGIPKCPEASRRLGLRIER